MPKVVGCSIIWAIMMMSRQLYYNDNDFIKYTIKKEQQDLIQDKSPQEETPAQLPSRQSNCVIPIYGVFLYETKWFADVVFNDIPEVCGCGTSFRDLEMLIDDFKDFDKQQEPPHVDIVVVMMLNKPPQPRFLEVLNDQRLKEFWKQHATLVHISDENELSESAPYYPMFKRVYRNYYAGRQDLASSVEYLKRGADPTKPTAEHVFWFPIGYSVMLLSSKSLRLPIWKRRKLFFWAGSTEGKPERGDMLASIRQDSNLMSHGEIHEYRQFQHLGSQQHLQLQPISYTRKIYEASIVPCPAGGSPDQFRISEALEVGAAIMIRKGHQHLKYLDLLDIKYIGMDSFSDSHEILNRALSSQEYRQELEAITQHNNDRWDEIKKLLARHFALSVCPASV